MKYENNIAITDKVQLSLLFVCLSVYLSSKMLL